MINKEKAKLNMKKQWTKFAIVTILYLLFLYWVKSWWGLLVIPFIYDAYITKKIRWQWWKDADSPVTRFCMSWVDALVFALVAVYFINQFFFQNFVIPSSSLEKSLLTGDYLFVSKVSYGPRIPQTPLTMPLTQHTMPLINMKSYIDWPHWDYRRVKGFGNVELNDIVVFNYPAGDSIVAEEAYQTCYYDFCNKYGMLEYMKKRNAGITAKPEDAITYFPEMYTEFVKQSRIDSLPPLRQREVYSEIYALGRQYLVNNSRLYGQISARPTDRRENYVKRCVGLPGQTLQIKNRVVYLDGKANKEPENVQYTYHVDFQPGVTTTTLVEDYDPLLKELGISNEDLTSLSAYGYIPLTKKAVSRLAAEKRLVKSITINTDASSGDLYPYNLYTGWTRDNYGPIWIPKKGASITLTPENLAIYERPIRVYEGNDLQVKNGKIYINGQQTNKYTFKLDYYWMMGDNRHNSMDSRYWGFVPEDHIVGKPIFIWWSSDPDRHGFGGIRWNRLFNVVDNIK